MFNDRYMWLYLIIDTEKYLILFLIATSNNQDSSNNVVLMKIENIEICLYVLLQIINELAKIWVC
jgi:hypothetical protein